MDELVRSVSNRLNVEEDVAQTAVGAILNFIKKHYVTDEGSLDFDQILEQIKGAKNVLRKEEEREVSTTATEEKATTATAGNSSIIQLVLQVLKAFGVLAVLKTFLEQIFGESATKMIESVEDGAELTAVFRDLKIDRDQGITVLKMLWSTLQEKLDADTLERIMASIPALKTLLETFNNNKKDE
ncbi:MAG: hypothetical protein SGBAC_011330 [Bacillariaceae sp.]